MSLYELESPNIFMVEAGDPEEMVTRLQAALADFTVARLFDVQLAGAGSGPLWQCHLIGSDDASTENAVGVTVGDVQFACVVAGNAVELAVLLQNAIDAAGEEEEVDAINKMVIAGAGDGPSFMAIAVLTID